MSLPPLSPEQRTKPARFDLRMSVLFAALFLPLGVHLPYFPLWLEARGFGADQIAVILAAPMFLRVATTPLITALADRARDRLHVIVLLSAAALCFSGGYFLHPGYGLLLAVSLAFQVAWTPLSPLADSLALSGVRRFGVNYAGLRIWGSISYLAGNFGGGVLVSRLGLDTVPAMISAGLALGLIAALAAPRLGRPRVDSPLSATALQRADPALLTRGFLLFAAGAGLISGSHSFLHGFVSIYWKSIGIGETVIGLLWAWAVLAEVMIFLSFRRWFGHRSPFMVLAVAGSAAVLRWLVFPWIWPLGLGIPGFFAAQTLHALSTGLMLIGVQMMIARTVPEARTGAAQGVAFFCNGVSNATVTLVSGPLFAAAGIDGLFAMAAVAAAGLGLILLAGRQPQSAGEGG